MRSSRLAWVLVWMLGLNSQAGAQNITPASSARAASALEGVWQGTAAIPGGPLELRFSLVALTSGDYFAALDAPMQKLSRVPAGVRQPAGTDSVLLLVPQVNSRFLARRSADGQLLTGTWCQPGVRTPLQLRHVPLPAATATGPGARFAPPYLVEDVTFQNFTARLRLAGTFTIPPGKGPFPAVVLVSDVGEQDRDGLPAGATQQASPVRYRLLGYLADYLTRHGVAVLRLDDRGVGQSGGSNAAATPTQRAGDVQAALNFLRTRPEVDLLRLGLVGHGEGANVALLVAAQPLAPAYVVGLGAYGLPGHEALLQQHDLAWQAQKMPPTQLATQLRRQRALYDLIRYSTNPAQTQAIVANLLHQGDAALSATDAQQQAAELLTPWSRAFLAFDPLEGLAAVQCPVLLISGLADEQAPPAQHLTALERELRAGGNRLVTAWRPVGINHLMQPPTLQWTMLNGELKPVFAPVVQEELRQWLATQLGK
jgi:pimeloyl-ACP methyl ester carboxylesterase